MLQKRWGTKTEKQIKWRGKGQARLMGKVVAIYAQNLTGSLFSYGVLLHLNIYTVVVKKFLLRVAAFAAQLVRGDNPELFCKNLQSHRPNAKFLLPKF